MGLKKSNGLKKNLCKPHKNLINITSHINWREIEDLNGRESYPISRDLIFLCEIMHLTWERKLIELKVNGCGLHPKYNECYN